MKLYAVLHELIGKGAVVSAYALDGKGLCGGSQQDGIWQ